MEEEKFKDLLEDEELTSLRLAALATKRKKEQNVDNDSSAALPINSIVTSAASASEHVSNQIPFVQSDRNAFNTVYSWRKQNQPSRRRGGAFPKNNTRSNLIVISPVSLNDSKDLEDKAPTLVLPQHKWCNSGNEDSMSPKTLRRTGPTRFNRHDSDSESSESDYENDNDSGSNETILQDEPSEHFPRLSPVSDTVPDGVEKKRRLSFQNVESEVKSDTFDKSETTSIYNLLKNPSYDSSDNKLDNLPPVQNHSDGRHVWNHSVENDYSLYKPFNNGSAYVSEPVNSTIGKQINSLVVSNAESCIEGSNFIAQAADPSWQRTDIQNNNSYYSRDSTAAFENSRGHEINDRKAENYSEKRQLTSEIHNSDSNVWQHGEKLRSNKSFFPTETSYNSVDSRNYKSDDAKLQFLGEDDLRFELKKRNLNQEMISQSASFENHSEMLEIRYGQSNIWGRNRQENSYEGSVNDVNSYGNKQEINYQRNRSEQSFIEEKNEYNSNLNSKQHERSLSRERIRQERCSSRERSRFGYSSGAERNRNDRSTSRCRSRHERSNSRGRSRRSISRNRRRNDRSSSQGRQRKESVEDSKSKSGRCFSEERDGHSQNKSSREYNFSQDKNRHEYNSSQNKSRFKYSSNQYRSKREHSSSSDSRHERSTSRDRAFEFSSNRFRKERSLSQNRKRFEHSSSRERSRHVHSSSQEKNKYEHSSSPDRSRPRSTESEDSRHEHSQSYERKRHNDSSSQDESDAEYNSSQGRKYTKRSSGDAYKKHNFKNRCDISSSQDREEYASSHKSERVRDNSKFEKIMKEESKLVTERSRLQCSSDESKKKVNKICLVEHNRTKDSYKNRYSRSHSSSSTTSSSSSSSAHSSRPKIRSVSSVVKSVPPKIIDVQMEQTHSEIKSVGKNISLNVSQSDVSSTSNKRNIDVGECGKLSSFKSSRMDIDFKASDNSKRVPVHMRLGVLPRKRVIQMPKDVEAAFVNSSSSSDGETVNTKCKRQNIRIVTDVCDDKSGFDFENKHSPKDKSKRSPDLSLEKSKRLKIKR